MKKIILIICWALAGLGLYSCSLDEPSYGKTTSDNYYQKESDIEQALTGAYLQLRTTWNEYALNHYFIGDCTTDDALKGGGGDGDGAVTTGARKLQDILRSLPEGAEVSLILEDKRLQVRSGRSRFTLQTLPANDFPRMTMSEGETKQFQISQKTFRQLLGKTQYSMAAYKSANCALVRRMSLVLPV